MILRDNTHSIEQDIPQGAQENGMQKQHMHYFRWFWQSRYGSLDIIAQLLGSVKLLVLKKEIFLRNVDPKTTSISIIYVLLLSIMYIYIHRWYTLCLWSECFGDFLLLQHFDSKLPDRATKISTRAVSRLPELSVFVHVLIQKRHMYECRQYWQS